MALDPLRVPVHSQRPGSSHSIRSVSRTSQRPTSRLSQRTIVKQPRLAALIKTLVKQVTHLDEGDGSRDMHERIDFATRRIDQIKQASVPDLAQIDAQVRGHVMKARINIQGSLADALNAKYAELKDNVTQRNDLDMEMKLATLPSHVQFLVGGHCCSWNLVTNDLSLVASFLAFDTLIRLSGGKNTRGITQF
jgi:gamma-tubulin complex component 5